MNSSARDDAARPDVVEVVELDLRSSVVTLGHADAAVGEAGSASSSRKHTASKPLPDDVAERRAPAREVFGLRSAGRQARIGSPVHLHPQRGAVPTALGPQRRGGILTRRVSATAGDACMFERRTKYSVAWRVGEERSARAALADEPRGDRTAL